MNDDEIRLKALRSLEIIKVFVIKKVLKLYTTHSVVNIIPAIEVAF